MKASYAIRLAESEDLPQVLGLWQSVGLVSSVHSDEEILQILRQESTLILLVAECEGRVIGTILGATDGWWGWLYRLAVAPEHRRRGIGEALVQEAESHLKNQGVRYTNTIVNRTNVAALKVLEKAGWLLDEDHLRLTKRL